MEDSARTLKDYENLVAWYDWLDANHQRKGDFIDTIFYCPYDIHELVTDADMSVILRELNEDHKFLLFLSDLRQCSSVKIAVIRGQSDRNIRKVRNAMLKKIRKKLLAAGATAYNRTVRGVGYEFSDGR